MKTINIKENWNVTRDRLKQKFIFLTDSDLILKEDDLEKMVWELRIKLGKTKEEMYKIISTP